MWLQNSNIRAVFLLFSVFALTLWLAACGGHSGGGTGSTSTSGSALGGTGSVAVTFTDAPGCDCDEINVTVTRIQLLSDSGAVTIFEGNKTFDLLQLSEISQFFVLADNVPAGPYEKVRLTLNDLEIVQKDDQGNVTETFHPHLPGNGKLDLNPRTMFFVVPGGTLMLEIDMDANSIHVVGTGNNKYQFRPEVFVNILEPGVLGKIIRLEGTVAELGDNEFKLCLENNAGVCVEVHVSADTQIFDAEMQGDPIDFNGLDEGHHVIVYARFRPDDGSPADDPDDEAENDFDVDALVIEVGPPSAFTVLTGTVANPVPTNNTFELLDAMILVQQGATRIFSKEGDELDFSDITEGRMVTASGVLSDSTLMATIVIVDMSAP
jgi:hypothetical protein